MVKISDDNRSGAPDGITMSKNHVQSTALSSTRCVRGSTSHHARAEIGHFFRLDEAMLRELGWGLDLIAAKHAPKSSPLSR